MQDLKDRISVYEQVADIYFKRKYFDKALDFFLLLGKESIDNLQMVFEKTAFCYQKLGDYENALTYYQKAELFDSNRTWNIKKIAQCLDHLGRKKEALGYLIQAEKFDTENSKLLMSIGQYYLGMNELDKALEYFYKLDFISTENQTVRRALAWTLFLKNNLQEASNYYQRIEEQGMNKHDMLNYAHILFCQKDFEEAVNYYTRSCEEFDTFNDFEVAFKEDMVHLTEKGITEEMIYYMLDALTYSTK